MNVVYRNFADAYQRVLCQLCYKPEYVSAYNGYEVNENINWVFKVPNSRWNLFDNEIRSPQIEFICKKLIWYLDGNPNVYEIERIAGVFAETNPGTSELNSNYGHLAFRKKVYDKYNNWSFSQYYWAFKSLKEDRDSKNAIIHFSATADCQYFGVKDFVKALNATFFIKENKLHITVVMRMEDVIFDLPGDFVWFSILQQQMLSHLKQIYPELELGIYTHIVGSLSLQGKQFSLAKEMLRHNFYGCRLPSLKEDLVTMLGDPTQITKQLIWDVYNDCEVVYNDTLAQAIFNGATQ